MMKKLRLILLCLPMIGFSCFSQTQSDSLAGFDEKYELDHILVHGIESSQINFYLDLAKRRYINRKYNLGIYAPPKNLKSSSAFDCAVDNWGFEDGTFGGWNQQGAVEIVNNGVDPYGGFSWVYPNGGNFSAKVSSDLNCCKDGRLDKTLTVPVNGETLMSFHFAMSIFNFPHVSTQAAKLWVEFYDGGGNLLPCPQYECYYSTDNGAVGVNNFQQTPQVALFYNPLANGDGPDLYPVTYADWNTVTLDLSAYQGQQITAVFRVEWCLPGPDWAYVLLDVDCPVNTFEPRDPCDPYTGPETLCGPDNMSSYTWYDPSGAVVGNNQCVNINAPGTYILEAMPDDVACTSASLLTFDYTIVPPLNISYLASNYNGNNISCNGYNDGSINTSVSGGTPGYSYSWIGPNGFSATTPDINNIFAGVYILEVTDANGCLFDTTFLLIEPTPLQTSITPTNFNGYNISCNGYSDGSIDLSVSGSVPGYNYLWNTGDLTEDISNLLIGTYSVDITDLNSCTTSTSVTLTEPTPLQTSVVSTTNYNGYDISCNGYSNGGIDLSVSGSIPGYTYLWNTGDVTEDLSNLPEGTYSVDITDANSCAISTSIILQQPDELIWNIDVYPDTCAKQVGKVDIQVSGGVPTYIYSWNIPELLPIAVQVPEGEYYIEIEDLNNCLINDTIQITNLIGPEIDFAILSNVKHLYDQLSSPIVFIDMTELGWQNALYWDWDFGDGTYGTDSIAFHSYQEIGEYDVLLQITTDHDCIDTLVKKVVIKEYDLFIPNAFTPNSSDESNKGFRPYGIGIDEFLMNIYSRQGELVYSTTKIEDAWNGKFNNSKKECQLGIYAYYIKVKDVFGAIHKYTGQVFLIR